MDSKHNDQHQQLATGMQDLEMRLRNQWEAWKHHIPKNKCISKSHKKHRLLTSFKQFLISTDLARNKEITQFSLVWFLQPLTGTVVLWFWLLLNYTVHAEEKPQGNSDRTYVELQIKKLHWKEEKLLAVTSSQMDYCLQTYNLPRTYLAQFLLHLSCYLFC